MKMSTFGKRMKELRQRKDVTLDKLAYDVNSTKATLSRYENNRRTPDIDFIYKIADYFNVTTDYLLGRTDDPNTVIIDNGNLPHALKDLDAIEVVKGAFDKGFSKEDIKEMLEFMEKMNKKNDSK
jgi:transcriptional regulator with XRE-family HTH domain